MIVLNDPDGLNHAVNKIYLQYFPKSVRPRSLITRNREEIKGSHVLRSAVADFWNGGVGWNKNLAIFMAQFVGFWLLPVTQHTADTQTH